VQDETVALHGGVGTGPLRALAALLFLGGIVYALVSGNLGIGAITFGLGAVVLGLDRLRVARSARAGHQVGAHAVRRVRDGGRPDLDSDRRGLDRSWTIRGRNTVTFREFYYRKLGE